MRKHLLITGLCCGLAFVLLTPAALAQTTGQMTDHQRIEALEAQVAALERRLDMAPTAAPTPATSHRQPAATATVPPASSDWSHLHRGKDSRRSSR